MKSKAENWVNIIGSIILIGLSYLMIYKSPNAEQIKIVIPLISATAGWMIHSSLNNLAKLDGYK